ncbi:MAG TPA: hypothetical protein ENI45_00605 [Thermoplasmatales archaeon]|nr:hypothetical protein [Thermoplasmatales archaeon]
MKRIGVGILVCTLLTLTCTAVADWNPEDGHKMHFPQLPDPSGWDVCATYVKEEEWGIALADDWRCTETSPINDIHFWGSWKNGVEGTITGFWIAIHKNIPASSDIPYSRPGETLWERYITHWKAVPIEGTWQGWFYPDTGEYLWRDHNVYYQYNIVNIDDPFVQKNGTIYWLSVSAEVKKAEPGSVQPLWGWKSSKNHWMDDACWGRWWELDWKELYEPPYFEQSLDLAFVITGGECCLEIVSVTGGLLDTPATRTVQAVIKNTGTATCTNVAWQFTFSGYIFSGPKTGTIASIAPGGTVTVSSDAVIGFAIPGFLPGTVTVTADAANNVCGPATVTKDLFVFFYLWYVIP